MTRIVDALSIAFSILAAFSLGFSLGRIDLERPDAHAVKVYVQVRSGAPDPSPLLAGAWDRATAGRGSLALVQSPSDANAVIEVLPGDGPNDSWQVNAKQRAIIISVGSAPVQRYGVNVIVHEIAHLWCCAVGGITDGHWQDDSQPGMMNASNYGVETGRFSQRELQALGLTAR